MGDSCCLGEIESFNSEEKLVKSKKRGTKLLSLNILQLEKGLASAWVIGLGSVRWPK